MAAIEHLFLRIPSPLKRQLEDEAWDRDISLNTLAREILERHYQPEGLLPIEQEVPWGRRSDVPARGK